MPKLVALEDWKGTPEHTIEVRHDGVLVWISPRPAYCDRGRWVANIDFTSPQRCLDVSIDWADGFPRYYMDVGRAIAEATEWLNWRLYKIHIACMVPPPSWLARLAGNQKAPEGNPPGNLDT